MLLMAEARVVPAQTGLDVIRPVLRPAQQEVLT
jgi:hypothetical protein